MRPPRSEVKLRPWRCCTQLASPRLMPMRRSASAKVHWRSMIFPNRNPIFGNMLVAAARRTPVIVAMLSKKAWYGPWPGTISCPSVSQIRRFRMKHALLGATSAIALLIAAPASAGGPSISYVPNSMVESTIISGPWTLHESGGHFAHDASGINPALGPPQPSPPPPLCGNRCALCGLLHLVR